MKRFMNKKVATVGIAVALVLGIGGAAFAYFTSSGGGTGSAQVGTAANLSIHQDGATVYDSTVAPLPQDMYSEAFEATGTFEFGNEIHLTSSTQPLSTVLVTMSSWPCETGSGATCSTTPGATYSVPITLNIYTAESGGVVGSLIASDTQTFQLPYRPSADNTNCLGPNLDNPNAAPGAPNGEWYDATTKTCSIDLNSNITFAGSKFTPAEPVLPGTVIYGIEYNTDNYGPNPIAGTNSPVDGLNVAVSDDSNDVSVGSDAVTGDFLDSTENVSYCNNSPSLGTSVFQYDPYSAPCTGGNAVDNPAPNGTPETLGYPTGFWVPAVQFNVTNPVSPDLYPGGAAQPINFTVDNLGSVPAYLGSVSISVASDSANGLVESTPGDTNTDVAGCYASWFGFTDVPVVVNGNIPVGNTDYLSSHTGAAISMLESGTNQDACEGAALGLVFTSS